MKMFTTVTYEACTNNGAKLSQTFRSKEECEKGITEANEKQIKYGYSPTNYFIVVCTYTKQIADNGDFIGEAILRSRI